MHRKAFFITLSILVVIVGGMAYLFVTDDAEPAKETTTSASQSQNKTTPQSAGTAASPGAYVDYSETAIVSATGTKILFFHAPWCPQCRALEEDIKTKGVPPGVTIIKVDYDASQALRQKYEVLLQTTLVLVDDAGNLVKKYVAYDEPTVEAIKNHLL